MLGVAPSSKKFFEPRALTPGDRDVDGDSPFAGAALFEPAGAGRRRRRRQFEVLPPSRSSTAETTATDGDGQLPPPPRLLQHC